MPCSQLSHKLTKIQLVHSHLFHSIPSHNINLTFPLYNVHNPLYNVLLLQHQLTYIILAMATPKLSTTLLTILSFFLIFATFTTACGTCKPKPNPTPKAPPVNPFCPRDTLKLGICADVLGLINVQIGAPPSGDKCCALLEGLADLEVAACLCTALKANVLGINLNVPIALSALVSACGKTIPPGFQCG